MWGFEHDPRADVVMALGFGYARTEFARFVSTLRATDYAGDIVLAAGPPEKFRNGVEAYLKGEGVLAYQFTYECYKKKRGGRRLLATPAGCVLTNWYAGGDARGPRPLAVARYEMYRAWLANYDEASWALSSTSRRLLPAGPVPLVDRSPSAPNLHLFAENRDVKTVGTCRFNSAWLNCWDRTLKQGRGLVNTIGAMNGFRVPAHKKGPLDTFWKIKDADGYILDWDGQYSAVVHQWDRFGKEVVGHIDRLARAYAKAKRGAEGEDGATATGRDDIRFATRALPRRGGVREPLKATVAAAARRAGAECVFLLPAEQLRRVDVDASALADLAAAGVLVREVPWIVPPHLSPGVPVESGGCCGLCGNQIFNPTSMCA
ncbi:hypothetical protein JL722_13224 [Aureococcus anophagefferens]|nr:hypothetical protein JL722_13224 [Aureococcus anophagefferens]